MQCDMHLDCDAPVSHLGAKGYIYCGHHATRRQASGYESVRRLRPWEVRWLSAGRVLPSYKIGPEPK